MSVFITVQNDTELDRIAFNLSQNNNNTHAANIRLQHPFSTRAVEWIRLYNALEENNVDAVLVSQFFDQDLLASSYLLAPIRSFKGRRINIKIALILPPDLPFPLISNALTEPVNVVYVSLASRHGLEQFQHFVNIRVPQNAQGSIIFVNDKEIERKSLLLHMTSDKFNDRPVQVIGFDEIHSVLLGTTMPAAIVTDTIEDLRYGILGPFTGLGLCVIIRSTPRLQGITSLLFSSRYEQPLETFDKVFVDDGNLEPVLDAFLKQV